MEFALSAKNCLILALSAKLCRSDESAIELGYFSLSAKLCRFWRPLIAVSHSTIQFTPARQRDEPVMAS